MDSCTVIDQPITDHAFIWKLADWAFYYMPQKPVVIGYLPGSHNETQREKPYPGQVVAPLPAQLRIARLGELRGNLRSFWAIRWVLQLPNLEEFQCHVEDGWDGGCDLPDRIADSRVNRLELTLGADRSANHFDQRWIDNFCKAVQKNPNIRRVAWPLYVEDAHEWWIGDGEFGRSYSRSKVVLTGFYQPILQSLAHLLTSPSLRAIGNIRSTSIIHTALQQSTNHHLFVYHTGIGNYGRGVTGQTESMVENEKRFAHQLDAWQRACLIAAFRRANPHHIFQEVILQPDVMWPILSFVYDLNDHESATMATLAEESPFEGSKWFASNYVQSYLPKRNMHGLKRKFEF